MHSGRLVAVDFGIMGRLGRRSAASSPRSCFGLITRDYKRAAEVHFWAGYVPPHHPVEVFAQALRAIGEPIHGRTADEISMADLLGQLFAYTDVFDMQTRPELILLQKTMVVVEGVARGLDPSLNMWVAAEPVARQWIEANLGPYGTAARSGRGRLGPRQDHRRSAGAAHPGPADRRRPAEMARRTGCGWTRKRCGRSLTRRHGATAGAAWRCGSARISLAVLALGARPLGTNSRPG